LKQICKIVEYLDKIDVCWGMTDDGVQEKFSKYASTHGPGLLKKITIWLTRGVKGIFQVISEMISQALGKE